MPVPSDKRPNYKDILSGGGSDFKNLWDSTDAAAEFEPLPPGRYRCLVVGGSLAESKTNKTPSYRVTFEVIEPADYAGRKVWDDLWLTAKALAASKRDLAKLRIHRPDQLQQAPPTGLLAEVKVSLRSEDDGTQYNRVVGFKIIGEAPHDVLAPDEDEMPDDGAAAEGDTCDSEGFDWNQGEQTV
jgi:hypothetical protein